MICRGYFRNISFCKPLSDPLAILDEKYYAMKITIEEDNFSYSVDYSKKNQIEGGMLEEYFPSVSEVCEDFYTLLENCYCRDAIEEYLGQKL